MAERICLLTFYPTKCKDNCFNCDCGGAEATKDMYVSIHNVQRVCAITGGAADTDEGEYIAEVIRNNLENMVIEAQPVKHGRWENEYLDDDIWWAECSNCKQETHSRYGRPSTYRYCPNCGARMDGEQE